MKKNWKEAPPLVRARIEAFLKKPELSPAERQLCAMQKAVALGFDFPEIATPVTDRLAALVAGDDRIAERELRRTQSLELQIEARTRAIFQGTRRWAAEPDHIDAQAAQAELQAKADRERELEARADAILASDETKRKAAARKRAESELSS